MRQSSGWGWAKRRWRWMRSAQQKDFILWAYTPRNNNNNIPCACERASVSIALWSSPDVNETKIEIWRVKKNPITVLKCFYDFRIYYNVGSNLASTPPHLIDDISPLRQPFRSERFNVRRRRRPRRATKKPYNTVIIIIMLSYNNNNAIVLYSRTAFVCVSRRAESRQDFIAELEIFRNGVFISAILNNTHQSL